MKHLARLGAPPPNVPANGLIGHSQALHRLLDLIQKVGQSRVSALIQGESGTGKELVAKAIYDVRSQGKFVPIDCAALPSNLVESELFGHERGAFTGALNARIGLLVAAHGGTAFFDEIGELPLEAQVKLLRVLQQQEIRPVGTNRQLPCTFRVIAATNRDLANEVSCGRFRLDLYYRLNVVAIEVPPLRDRREDILGLVAHFLNKMGSDCGVAPDLLRALMAHSWPGNVRELENCVARLLAMTSDDDLHVEDLPFHVTAGTASSLYALHSAMTRVDGSPQHMTGKPPDAGKTEGPLSLGVVERLAIERALAAANGSTIEAARALGISRTTLYRRRKNYGNVAAT